MPWCRQTWFPVWNSPRQHQSGSSSEIVYRIFLHLRWCSTLHHLHGNSHKSVHRPGVSQRWWRGLDNCPRSAKSSGRDHLGGCEQTLRCREAWRISARSVPYDTWYWSILKKAFVPLVRLGVGVAITENHKMTQFLFSDNSTFQAIQLFIKTLILQKSGLLTSWLRSIGEMKENVLLFFHFSSGLNIEMRR